MANIAMATQATLDRLIGREQRLIAENGRGSMSGPLTKEEREASLAWYRTSGSREGPYEFENIALETIERYEATVQALERGRKIAILDINHKADKIEDLEQQLAEKDAVLAGLARLLERFMVEAIAQGQSNDRIREAQAALAPDFSQRVAAEYRNALAVAQRVNDDAILLSLRDYASASSSPHQIAAEMRAILLGTEPVAMSDPLFDGTIREEG